MVTNHANTTNDFKVDELINFTNITNNRHYFMHVQMNLNYVCPIYYRVYIQQLLLDRVYSIHTQSDTHLCKLMNFTRQKIDYNRKYVNKRCSHK